MGMKGAFDGVGHFLGDLGDSMEAFCLSTPRVKGEKARIDESRDDMLFEQEQVPPIHVVLRSILAVH